VRARLSVARFRESAAAEYFRRSDSRAERHAVSAAEQGLELLCEIDEEVPWP